MPFGQIACTIVNREEKKNIPKSSLLLFVTIYIILIGSFIKFPLDFIIEFFFHPFPMKIIYKYLSHTPYQYILDKKILIDVIYIIYTIYQKGKVTF